MFSSTGVRAAAWAVLSALASVAPGPGLSAAVPPGPGNGPPGRIVLIGLDGADWQIAGPLIDQGRLPNLARLRGGGAWGDLRSDSPMLSPLLWTSIATGKKPGEHGIIDFLVRDPASGQNVPITSTFRKTKALWNILSEQGRSSDFIGWWATWPAETIRGHMVSDRLAYSLFGYSSRPEDSVGLVSPESYLDEIAPMRVRESDITLEDLRRFAPITRSDLEAARAKLSGDQVEAYSDPVNHLVRILASTRTYHAIALDLLRKRDSDLLSIYYQGIDEVCHRFAQYIPPKLDWVDERLYDKYRDVVTRYYEYQDELLGDLVEAAGDDATIVIVSDHGFVNGSDRPDFPPDIELKAGRWHRLYGVVLLSGPGIRAGKLEPTSIYDITPTLLYLSGLPVATDMVGKPALDAFTPEFRSRHRLATVDTFDDPEGRHADVAVPGSSAEINEEILAKLKSLGYVASTDISTGGLAGEGATPATLTNMINTATLQLNEGKLGESEATLRAIIERLPDHGNSHSMLSEVLEKQGRLDEAYREARTALNLLDEPPDRLISRFAHVGRRLGQLQDAKQYFARATQLRPGRAEPWVGLGIVQALSGDMKAAESSYLHALDLDPRSSAAVTGLYNVFDRGQRSREIFDSLQRAAEANPDSASHHTLLGMMQLKLGRPGPAEKQLKRALELDPESDLALAALSNVLLATDRVDDARVLLEKAVARRGDQVEVRMALGRVYAKLTRFGEATRQMSEAVRLEPDSADAHAQLGMLLMMQRQLPRAVENVERAIQLDPALYEPRLHLAIMYHDLQALDRCEATLKGALEMRPNDLEPHKLLVSLYREMGREADAREALERLQQLSSGAAAPAPRGP